MIAVRTNPIRPTRAGFTLLELLLASAIAAFLMAALYTAMEVHLRYAQAGRDMVDESMIARQLFARIAADLSGCLTPVTATPTAAASGTGATGTTGAATGTTGAATGATDPAALVGTPSMTTSGVTPFSGGLLGDSTMVTVWVSTLPPAGTLADPTAGSVELGVSDIRRITYLLADGMGLARQEVARVTADDAETQLPPSPDTLLRLAPEVAELYFSYFDGANWTDIWDGTALGEDGATPVGPPRAVLVTIGLRHPSRPDTIKQYRRVVAISAANAQPIPADTTGDATIPTTPTTPPTGGGGGL